MAWRFLFGLTDLPAPTAKLDLVSVRDTLAAALAAKAPLRPPPEESTVPATVDIRSLRGAEAFGRVDIDQLVSAARKEAAEARPAQRDMVTKLREWIAAGRPALVSSPSSSLA